MRILVTNDDGIDSPGLWALAEAMSRVGETLVVAPDKQQSGVGTSVSLYSGMSIAEVSATIQGVRAYAIGGTPSDCVMVGLRRLAQGHIGLVVSGINLGANVGNDILYSGTVMATLQGYYRKIPSLAISLVIQSPEEEPRFDVASKVAEFLALSVKSDKIPTAAILNTNVPNIPREQIKGIVTTRTASSGFVQLTEVQHSSSLSYSTGIHKVAELDTEEGTDIWAITEGLISITPLRPDVTAHNLIPTLAEPVLALQSDLLKTAPDDA
jgi:5'-nucleotidase